MNSSQDSKFGSNYLILLYEVDKLIAAYFLPPAIAMNFCNNILIIVLFLQINKIRHSLPPTIFLNYLSMAMNDIANSFPIHLTHMLGIFL